MSMSIVLVSLKKITFSYCLVNLQSKECDEVPVIYYSIGETCYDLDCPCGGVMT